MPENETKKSLHLCEMTPTDIEEVVRFIKRVSAFATSVEIAVERLSWILLQSPARVPGDPLGWLLRTQPGELVGCMCCAHQKFHAGQTTLTLMMANSFYVDDQHRGGGASIFLKYLQLGRRYPLFVSSANPMVAQMWQKLGGKPIANSDSEVIGILRWPPLVAETVFRNTASERSADIAAKLAAAVCRSPRRIPFRAPEEKLLPIETPEEAVRICEQHHTDKLTSGRDVQFLKWRYFSHTASTTRLFTFCPRGGEKQSMVAVQLQNRGYKQQIRALQVLDIWGEPNTDSYLAIAACLCREFRDRIDMLVFRCLNSEQRQVLKANGFKVRSFPAPIAWCADKYKLLPTDGWYFVPADGDMFL